MRGDDALFFGSWLQKPRQIAAVTPSGKRLAQTMAELVDLDRPGPVLELGAGTGGITRRLLQAGRAFALPVAIGPLGIAGNRIAYVWRNLPPAQVWAYFTLADANAREKQ